MPKLIPRSRTSPDQNGRLAESRAFGLTAYKVGRPL